MLELQQLLIPKFLRVFVLITLELVLTVNNDTDVTDIRTSLTLLTVQPRASLF